MSEFCDSAHPEFFAELSNVCRILQVLFGNIVFSPALTAATANAKHFGVKVIR